VFPIDCCRCCHRRIQIFSSRRTYDALVGRFARLDGKVEQMYQPAHRRTYGGTGPCVEK
jgi:hypothetical protein